MSDLITQRWGELEPLLDALLDLPPEQRADRLAQCADTELRAALARLLEHDARTHSGIEQVGVAVAGGGGLEGQRLGPYLIGRPLGEGGMGAVFLATRETAEFTQRVALKLLRSSVYSAAQQKQFRREQRIHARLEHPHIARVYDSGISAAGVPYFALEYIEGEHITDYCDRQRLAVDARLALFATVCDTVAFAHQNLIVHRDLKPSNILVDTNGEPKLLDFGIAKLLEADTGESAATATAPIMFTPRYAAPEQFTQAPITTATDVYALGLLLAELLTGKVPSHDATGIARDADAAAATARATNLPALRRRLHGDLEAIVRQATQIDPLRRYASAAALRDDVTRHLDGRPIRARPDAAAYRIWKFLQRHRIAVVASLMFAAMLVIATAVSLYEAGVARREATRASAEAERANAVKTFVLDLFESSAPGNAEHIETADAMLAKGLQQAREKLAAQPELQIDVLSSVGDIQHRRGQYDAARAPLQEAVDLARERLGAGNARTLNAVVALSRVDEARSDFTRAQAELEPAIAAYRATGAGASPELAHAVQQLGMMQLRQGQVDPAIALEREALTMYQALLPADSVEINEAMIGLGDALDHANQREQAIALYRDVVARTRRIYGDTHVLTAQALSYLSGPLLDVGRLDEAETVMREALAIDRKVYSGANRHMMDDLYGLGKVLLAKDRIDESEALFREEYAQEEALFPDGPNTATTLKYIAITQALAGHYEEAEKLQRESLDRYLRTRGADHPYVAQSRTRLARILIHENKLDEAQTLLDAALAADRQRYGESHPNIAADLIGRAELAAARNDPQRAVADARAAIAMRERALPAGHDETTAMRLVLGENLLTTGAAAEAQAVFKQALTYARAATPPLPALLAHSLACLSRASAALGDAQTAADLRRQAEVELTHVPASAVAKRDEVKSQLAAVR